MIFSGVAGTDLILGRLNGQNDEVVRFRDLSGDQNFTGAANGNDIKINDTTILTFTVFNSTNLVQLGTTREFSVWSATAPCSSRWSRRRRTT